MCCGAIINSRLERVIYGAEDKKSGSAESVQKIFELPYNHKPRVIKGLMADECSSVLSDFFRQLRERKKALSNKKNGKI